MLLMRCKRCGVISAEGRPKYCDFGDDPQGKNEHRWEQIVDIVFTKEECKALYELIDTLSGGNIENSFTWDSPNDPTCPETSACVKLFKAKGRELPEDLK